MESSVNFFAGIGYVVKDAQFFTTRSDRPKVVFRMVLPRHRRRPRKSPETGDYYSVVAVGDQFVPLVGHLRQGVPVVVFGYVQSRDITQDGKEHTVSEIGAEAIYLIREMGDQK